MLTRPTDTNAGRVERTMRETALPYTSCRRRVIGDRCRSIGALRSRMKARAGVTVSATTSEARTARPYEMTSGWKNAPDSPLMKKTGETATTSINVA